MNLLRNTVFNPIDKRSYDNEILAILFHRSAFTIYSIYAVWGTIYILNAIPSLANPSNLFVSSFGFFIAPIAFISAMGALRFPRWGRMELFAASSLITLVTIFLVLISGKAFAGDIRAIDNLILNCVHLVIPIARVVYIYKTLVHKAREQNR